MNLTIRIESRIEIRKLDFLSDILMKIFEVKKHFFSVFDLERKTAN